MRVGVGIRVGRQKKRDGTAWLVGKEGRLEFRN
jgi:hypothetical protein